MSMAAGTHLGAYELRGLLSADAAKLLLRFGTPVHQRRDRCGGTEIGTGTPCRPAGSPTRRPGPLIGDSKWRALSREPESATVTRAIGSLALEESRCTLDVSSRRSASW